MINLEELKKSGFGSKNTSVIVVDNFYKDPDSIRNFAINSLKFSPSDLHKGERSAPFILDGTQEQFETILGKKITNWQHPNYANGVFQFCISKDQVVYHIDSQMFAGVVFLTPDAPLRSGTQTFKSKITNDIKFGHDLESNARFRLTFKPGQPDHNFYNRDAFELVDSIANIYNRLILWDARSIHAAESYFGDSASNGRLFHLFFFDIDQ